MRNNLFARSAAATLAAGVTTALALAAAPAAFAADADRYAGSDRYETAIAVSNAFGTAETVYVARGDNQADAVSGGKLKGGPLLLVNETQAVREKVANQIKKLGAKNVIVLGGTAAVSDETVKAIAGTAATKRIAGNTRYATAVEISKTLNPETAPKVYLANGQTLVDALVGGSIVDNAPILLTNGSGTLPVETVAEIKRLKPSEVVALGGEKAVLPSELSAASTINGAGGGLGKDEATAKAKADLVKALREANMAVNGWLTVASGKTVDQFLASGPKSGSPVKADLETTWPRVLVSEVIATDVNDGWFAVDNDSDTKSAKDAKAAQLYVAKVGSAMVKGFVGSSQVATDTAEKASDAETAKSQVRSAVNVVLVADTASATTPIGQGLYDQLVAKFGKAVFSDPTTGAPLTETTTLGEFAKMLGITVSLPVNAAGLEAQRDLYKNRLNALYDAQATTDAQATLTASQDALKLSELSKAGTTPTEAQIQAYMGGAGAKASRIAGDTRWLTALEIAKVAYPSGSGAKVVYVANGIASADATVAGFIDNKSELAGPVLLSTKTDLPAEVTAYLKAAHTGNSALTSSTFKVLGGLAVVEDSVITAVKGALS